ncbi:hypothetical protein ABE10_03820 [Bacillus toyonensis]|nr:hypothetical protein [Bacillus toyonensis]
MHLGDELAHVLQGRGSWGDDDLQARIEWSELEVGDHHGDLDQFVDPEVESRHLAVDPDEPVVLGRRNHVPILWPAVSGALFGISLWTAPS